MGKMLFTKEEKKDIEKSLGFVLDDIREMWKLSQVDEIYLNMGIAFSAPVNLLINESKVTLYYSAWDGTSCYCKLERKGLRGNNRIPSDYEVAFTFLKKYDDVIRPLIEGKIKETLTKKGLGLEALEAIKKHYDKEASIDIELPPTNNQHTIEITQEDGKNVGIINFGDRTIKIITNGDIVLLDRRKEPEKVKKMKG